VKIHNLDPEDKTLLENELGGVLRSIEFIYESAGVNRPLTPSDNPEKNLNKTYYRDQINKVANAVKEIISTLKKHSLHLEEVPYIKTVQAPAKKLRSKIIFGSLILLTLIIAGIFLVPRLIESSEPIDKSIAVLPFDNLSNDPEQEYFSDGMVDAILDHLFKVGELKVISRTSSMRYKDSVLPLKTIARELGVSAILEGSVQKIGNKVRITAQLIDTKNDTHLWSETFDRDLSDVFLIQSEVAQNVARELKVKLIQKETVLIKPVTLTNNQIAYDYYLKGMALQSKQEPLSAIEMFSKAIQEDPVFAIAYAQRSRAHSFIYWTKRQAGWKDHKALALDDLMKASDLNPDLPEVKIARLYYYYQVKRDYENTLKTINELKSETPNFADLYTLSGYIMRRMGQYEKSISEQKTGIQLDPFHISRISELADTYTIVDQYDNSIACNRQGLTLFPEIKAFKFGIYNAYLCKTSDLKIALKESGLNKSDVQYDLYYYSRQFDKAIEFTKGDTLFVSDQFEYFSTAQIIAFLYYLAGNQSLSITYADSAIMDLKEKMSEFPDDDRFYASLGFCYVYSGDFKEAVASGEKAVDLKPVKLDALQGVVKEEDLMNIYVLTGNTDLALDKMNYLLSIPSNLHTGEIKIDPIYDKLRDLPRFKKIINSVYKQLTVY
jgi:TolB-like protein